MEEAFGPLEGGKGVNGEGLLDHWRGGGEAMDGRDGLLWAIRGGRGAPGEVISRRKPEEECNFVI